MKKAGVNVVHSIQSFVRLKTTKVDNELKKNLLYVLDLLESPSKLTQDEKIQIYLPIFNSNCLEAFLPLLNQCHHETITILSTILILSVSIDPQNSISNYLSQNSHVFHLLCAFIYPANYSFESHTFAHRIFQGCCYDQSFIQMIFQDNFILKFTNYLLDGTFDQIISAFLTYDSFLTSFPAISNEYIINKWDLYNSQFQQLLCCNNFIVPLSILQTLIKIFGLPQFNQTRNMFLSEYNNYKIILHLLFNSSLKVQQFSYHIFKYFVINPEKTLPILTNLVSNQSLLLAYLRDFILDRSTPELEEEKLRITSLLSRLSL